MKFDVKKKSFKEALGAVHGVASRLSMPNTGSDKGISSQGGLECALVAVPGKEKKGKKSKEKVPGELYIVFTAGQLYVRSKVKDVTVHKEGFCLINATTFLNAMKVSGDMFKGSVSGSKMAMSCGRSKASLDIFKPKKTDAKTVMSPPSGSPKFDIHLQDDALSQLFWAVDISADRQLVRYIHFSKGNIRAESTDQYRAVVVKAKAKGIDKNGSVILSQEVASAIYPYLKEQVNVGWNDKVFAVKCAHTNFYACVPLTQGTVRDLSTMLGSLLGSAKKAFTVNLDSKDLASALGDVSVLAVSADSLRDVTLTFTKETGKISSRIAKGVESDFDLSKSSIKSGKEKSIHMTIAYLMEALEMSGTLTITSYERSSGNGFITVESEEQENLDSYLCSIPQLPSDPGSKKKKKRDEED